MCGAHLYLSLPPTATLPWRQNASCKRVRTDTLQSHASPGTVAHPVASDCHAALRECAHAIEPCASCNMLPPPSRFEVVHYNRPVPFNCLVSALPWGL
eukprot:4288330-Prymnesium_polylepis.2